MINLYNKRVMLTGPHSMIGRCVEETLIGRGVEVTDVPHRNKEGSVINDLVTREYEYGVWQNDPQYVLHLAGYNGGISFNKKYPADIFYKTVMMGVNLINSCVKHNKVGGNIEKIVFLMPSCALCPCEDEAFEEYLYAGPPHPSVECHGLAKRAVESYGRQVEKQHGIKFVAVIGNNSFGPYDHFCEEKGKVISGMIKRFVDAKEKGLLTVQCWGTGEPKRQFIYCKDMAEGLVQLLEKYDYDVPVNLSSDYEITMKDLAQTIADAVGYKGNIEWDITKPNGQMRKRMNLARMSKYVQMDFTPFDKAMKETVDWYIANKDHLNG